METWLAALLGLVQGITEFIPVSSSAHLRIFPALFGKADPGAAFSAVLQLGTLLSLLWYFRKDLFVLVPKAILYDRSSPTAKLPLYLLVGTLPIAVAGIVAKPYIESSFRPLWVSAMMLVVFAFVIGWADKKATITEVDTVDKDDTGEPGGVGEEATPRAQSEAKDTANEIVPADTDSTRAKTLGSGQWFRRAESPELLPKLLDTREETISPEAPASTNTADATKLSEGILSKDSVLATKLWMIYLVVGCAQVLALVPGVSRSGATIACGLLLGLSRPLAAKVSFLLGIPAILGAGVFELPEALASLSASGTATTTSGFALIVGCFCAFVSGYFVISWLLRFLASGTLRGFVGYRIVVGGIILLAIATGIL